MRDSTSVPIMVASVADRLFARGLARNVEHLIGHHVDHLFQLGRKGLARLRALAGDFGAERRHRAAMAGIVAMQRRQIGLDDGSPSRFSGGVSSAILRQRSVERSIA